jgi:asparagine synthase (glutamine-hydrolysing)
MCRVSGIISKKFPLEESIQKVDLMSYSLKHGGPDDCGIYSDKNTGLVFGNRRLSLIDISANGHQPMADTEKKIWITFNGEIYNFLELRTQLINEGCKFHSKTDTEVVIVAYLKWGTLAFPKFRGMFGFALFDSAKSVTYLVRDSMGIKPLYYHINDGTLSFASEIRAFKAAEITMDVDEDWRVRFLAFGHIPEPYTTLKDVFNLQKGHYLVWDNNNGNYSIKPFTIANNYLHYLSDVNAVHEQLHDTLTNAVNRQLIADAPIGVFLSGGIDSSLITLLANKQKHQNLKTVSIYFNEKEYNERQYQKIIIDKIDGEKFEHLVRQQDFETFFPKIMLDMDMPTTDGINTWFISKYSNEVGLKAVLSGLGADELFGGYPSFNRIKYLKYLRKLPYSFFKAADFFTTDKYKRISFLANDHPVADYLFLRGLFIPENIARLLDIDLKTVNDILFNNQPIGNVGNYDEEHAAWFETNMYMQNQLLRDTDVMSMCHGLEVRVPFLDEDFQNFSQSIDPKIRFNKKQAKKILIDSFSDVLPYEIWNRPKMGFSFPLQDWMRNHKEVFNEDNFKGKTAKNLVKQFNEGHVHWSKVFALYQIQAGE